MEELGAGRATGVCREDGGRVSAYRVWVLGSTNVFIASQQPVYYLFELTKLPILLVQYDLRRRCEVW